ncbi:hypothetical protein ACWX0P_29130 [Vibrio mediterranei]
MNNPTIRLLGYHSQTTEFGLKIEAKIHHSNKMRGCVGSGNGLMSALLKGLKEQYGMKVNIIDYQEHI